MWDFQLPYCTQIVVNHQYRCLNQTRLNQASSFSFTLRAVIKYDIALMSSAS